MRYWLVFFFLLIHAVLFAQNAKIDSLKKVIETTKVDTVKGRSLGRLCNQLRKIGDFETGLIKAEEGLKISDRQKDNAGMSECLNNIGLIYKDQGNYSEAAKYYQNSLKVYQSTGDKKGISKCYTDLGNLYAIQDIPFKALDYYQKSLKILAEIKDERGLANNYLGMGNLYHDQSNEKPALDYYLKSSDCFEKIKDLRGVGLVQNNIGLIYAKDTNTYSKAIESYKKCLGIFEQLGDQVSVAGALSNIGLLYLYRDNATALDYFKRGLLILEQLGNTKKMSFLMFNISKAYRELHNPTIARQYAEKALYFGKQSGRLEEIMLAMLVLSEADSALGNYKSAYENYKRSTNYKDSLYNEDKAKEFGRVESKYQFEKEAEEAKRKQAEQAKIEAEATQRRNNLQYLTIFAGIIGLFAGLVFLGKFRIPTRVLDIAIFAGLLITFEFLLILFDPWFDRFSGGIPFYKLGFNALVAFGFAPLHGFLEDKLKKRLVKGEKL